jgi:hypothetical protein
LSSSLHLQTEIPREVIVGEPVPIALRVTNIGARPVELSLVGRSVTFDITVSRRDGAVVWRRLERQTVPMILQLRVLAPEETLEVRHDWDQRAERGELVEPGTYLVQGALLTDGAPLSTPPALVRVVAREG